MVHHWLFFGVLLLPFRGAVVHAQGYTSCAPGYYGRLCDGKCKCTEHEDCDDGISGDGTCTCSLGHEIHCRGTAFVKSGLVRNDREILGAFSGVVLKNSTLQSLQVDSDMRRQPRQVKGASVSLVLPMSLKTSTLRLALFNSVLAARLGLDAEIFGNVSLETEIAEVLSGRRLLEGSKPFAHAYGGHQFGSWAGQLGDGRATSLGEMAVSAGIEDDQEVQLWEIALKGSGKTPFSRGGDGRAALANAAREFFAPIFLQACGVPSVGTLSVVASDAEEDRIVRDEWYDGDVSLKKPGVVSRIAPSFLRFGSVQLAAKRQGFHGLVEVIRFALATIARIEARDDAASAYLERIQCPVPQRIREDCFYTQRQQPSCAARYATMHASDVLQCFLERVTKRTAALVAAWTATGFAHGVMNTDNLSVLGITLDLNVFGFMSKYDVGWSPNHIDDESRYAFGMQRSIAKWNLERLADALTGTRFEEDHEPDAERWWQKDRKLWLGSEVAREILGSFDDQFDTCYTARLELRLGFPATGQLCSSSNELMPACLTRRWIQWLEQSQADYPRASRGLAEISNASSKEEAIRLAQFAGIEELSTNSRTVADLGVFIEHLFKAHEHLESSSQKHCSVDWKLAIRASVPAFVPRGHILREAARFVEREGRAARQFLDALQHALQEPFDGSNRSLAPETDDPQKAWSGIKIPRDDTQDWQLAHSMAFEAWLRGRLEAMPPKEMQQLRTSCGAQ